MFVCLEYFSILEYNGGYYDGGYYDGVLLLSNVSYKYNYLQVDMYQSVCTKSVFLYLPNSYTLIPVEYLCFHIGYNTLKFHLQLVQEKQWQLYSGAMNLHLMTNLNS